MQRTGGGQLDAAGRRDGRGNAEGGRMHLRVARRARVIETNSILRIVSNGEGATRRAVFGTGNPRHPKSEKATIGETRESVNPRRGRDPGSRIL